MLFRNVLIDDQRFDLLIEGTEIRAREPAGTVNQDVSKEMVEGGMITPVLAEPHVHLDATQLGARTPNRSGTLVEGIENWAAVRDTLTVADVHARARKTIGWYRDYGCTRIRTHVDTGNLDVVAALVGLAQELKGEVELQVVAFPQEGILRESGQKEQWEAAVGLGCDAVGAIPHFESSHEAGWETVRLAFSLADKHDLALDFHCDETDDPQIRNLWLVCEEAARRGNGARVVAGHCTAMHSYPDDVAESVIADVVRSGVQVVTNPLDNIVLQGRGDRYPKRRGLTRVDELWAAGATVGIGHDSVVDPWYRLGTANLVDAAYMLVHAGHLTSETEMRRAFSTLHTENHRPFGPIPAPIVGAEATFLHWAEEDPIEVLRLRPRPILYQRGVRT